MPDIDRYYEDFIVPEIIQKVVELWCSEHDEPVHGRIGRSALFHAIRLASQGNETPDTISLKLAEYMIRHHYDS